MSFTTGVTRLGLPKGAARRRLVQESPAEELADRVFDVFADLVPLRVRHPRHLPDDLLDGRPSVDAPVVSTSTLALGTWVR
jgi:hypothetical protein